jgi:predicted peroxiredoxin
MFSMPKIVIVGTSGPSDPTRASMPFHIGKGAIEAGYEVGIVLSNYA